MKFLITGASGYLGAELVKHIVELQDVEIYALVRQDTQAKALEAMGIKPLRFDLYDRSAVVQVVKEKEVTVVFHLADARSVVPSKAFIEGLAAVKEKTGKEVHYLFTSGAKMFSSHVGIRKCLSDAEGVYDTQKTVEVSNSAFQAAVDASTVPHELGEELGVRTYVFAPSMVYGPRAGFGNKISIQYVAIVKLALNLKTVYLVPGEEEAWPFCHLADVTSLYYTLFKAILAGKEVPYGKKDGYYFAVNDEEFRWKDLYEGIATSLFKRGLVEDGNLHKPTDQILEEMGKILGGPKVIVPFSVGGRAVNGRALGWVPEHGLKHLLSTIDDEIAFILKNLEHEAVGRKQKSKVGQGDRD